MEHFKRLVFAFVIGIGFCFAASESDAHIIRNRCACGEEAKAVVVKEKVVFKFVPFKRYAPFQFRFFRNCCR